MRNMRKSTYVNSQGRTIRPNAAELRAIRMQPGYDRNGGAYAIMPFRDGAETRLYKSINGQWMDASLADVPKLAAAAKRNLI